MSTLGALINRILANVGKADVGENRDLILADLLDLLRVDLPRAGGASFAQGTVSLTAGVTGSVREDGVYPFPRTLRSFEAVLQFVDNSGMPNHTTTFADARYVYTDPDVFYSLYKYGDAQADGDYGKPFATLIHGRSVHLRPIPKQTAVAAPWWGTLALAGTLYVAVDALDESSECPVFDYEPALIAQGTILEAARRGRSDVMAVYAPLLQVRREELAAISMSTMRRVQPSGDY